MAKSEKINYSTPSGFPEFLPSEKRLEVYLLDIIRRVFESYGFTPIEAPAIERLEVLQAKGNRGENQGRPKNDHMEAVGTLRGVRREAEGGRGRLRGAEGS